MKACQKFGAIRQYVYKHLRRCSVAKVPGVCALRYKFGVFRYADVMVRWW